MKRKIRATTIKKAQSNKDDKKEKSQETNDGICKTFKDFFLIKKKKKLTTYK